MTEIKIGRKTYEIKKDDYILFNGACYQFCAGDKRCLKFEGWSRYSSLVIPKVRLKEIPFGDMRKVEKGKMIKWYF